MVTAVGVDGRFAGLIVMADEVREEAREALADLKGGGFRRIVLVTGDRADVAAAVAARRPIDEVVADATPAQYVEVVRREAPTTRLRLRPPTSAWPWGRAARPPRRRRPTR